MLAVDVVAQDCGVWPLIVPVRAGHVPRRWQAQAKDAGFDGAADTVCDVLGGTRRVVLTGLGENAEAAGAWAASLLLRTRRIAVDGRGLPRLGCRGVGGWDLPARLARYAVAHATR